MSSDTVKTTEAEVGKADTVEKISHSILLTDEIRKKLEERDTTCAICLSSVFEELLFCQLPCKHTYCFDCVCHSLMTKPQCPQCSMPVTNFTKEAFCYYTEEAKKFKGNAKKEDDDDDDDDDEDNEVSKMEDVD
jgi:hypothetical protein